jgi:hypothetical protein
VAPGDVDKHLDVGAIGGACQVSVGAFRNVASSQLRQQITDKLRAHLAEHM